MKKIISLILIFALLLSVCTFTAFAEETEEIVTDNMKFLQRLDIVRADEEGNYPSGNEPLTRIGLAKMFYGIMIGGEIPDYSEQAIEFSDVEEEENEVVLLVSRAGIMNGTGSKMFGTQQNVTYIQMVKAMVTFLGYKTLAEREGGWPMGYYGVATRIGIIKNPPNDMNSALTYNGAADMFRVAADADMMIQTVYSEEKLQAVEGLSYLEHYMGIKAAKGIVSANTITDFDDEHIPQWGNVKIDNTLMDVPKDASEIYDKLGYSVLVFYSEESNGLLLHHFEERYNEVTEIDGGDITFAQNGKIKYYIDGASKEQEISYASGVVVIYNGTVAKSYDESVLNPFKGDYDGKIVCIDNNRDKVADVISVEAYQTIVCGGIMDNVVTSKVVPGVSIDFNLFSDNTLSIVNSYGEPIMWQDIVSDDILNYYKDLNGKITKIAVTIDATAGKVEEIEYMGNKISALKIGGVMYECGRAMAQSPDAGRISVGDIVTAYLNVDAKIGAIEKKVADYKLAFLVDFAKDDGLSSTYRIKLFETNGLFKVYTIANNPTINGRASKPENILTAAGTSGNKIARQVVKYNINEAGELYDITFEDSSKDASGEYASDFFVFDGFDGTEEKSFNYEMNTFGLQISVGNSTYVFMIPDEAARDNEKRYAVKNGDSLRSGTYMAKAYGTNRNSGKIAAFTYETATVAEDISTSSSVMVLDSVKQVLNEEEGTAQWRVSGNYYVSSSSRAYDSFIVESESVLKIGKGGAKPEAGDVVKYVTDATDTIIEMQLILDKSEDALYNMKNPSNPQYPSSGQRYAYGEVIYNDGEFITVETKDTDGTIRRESYPMYRFRSNGLLFTENENGEGGVLSVFDQNKIYDRETYGDRCSKIFTQLGEVWWYMGIMYND